MPDNIEIFEMFANLNDMEIEFYSADNLKNAYNEDAEIIGQSFRFILQD